MQTCTSVEVLYKFNIHTITTRSLWSNLFDWFQGGGMQGEKVILYGKHTISTWKQPVFKSEYINDNYYNFTYTTQPSIVAALPVVFHNKLNSLQGWPSCCVCHSTIRVLYIHKITSWFLPSDEFLYQPLHFAPSKQWTINQDENILWKEERPK